ncbi:HelD family protein [Phytoactinopolyspora halotolerans]|uniref:HelD family protein n=1 Tax=Phytoactinopolyspora halotolerans TaxID=1981512 RepID=UPI001C208AAD|nr:helicase [Phytoactinopolyspora halotolerans]
MDEQFSRAIKPAQSSTHQGRFERDASVNHYAERAARLASAEHGLVIGRLDIDSEDEPLYIGRAGIYSEDYDPLLIDWRAPAATPFYRATSAERLGVRRRRHIHLRGRDVVRIDDDVLALDNLDDDERRHLTGEAALLSSLESARTGRMGDIVATIQAEQDRVIRSDPDGILVVEGGPGTGKTVVALHRAAYLLYTYRRRLAANGVLVVGPNATFLRYIDQVLPGLGETDVVLSSVGGLYPGVETERVDAPATAIVKGDLRMADVLAQAVASNERAPIGGLRVTTDRDVYFLDDATCRRIRDNARERAQRTRQPHNRMRKYVVADVLDELTEQALGKIEAVLDGVDIPEEIEDEDDRELVDLVDRPAVRQELKSSPGVREALDILWPELTPEGLLSELYTDERFRADVAPQLTQAERDCLHRADPAAWTVADVPLLDEAAALVGELDVVLARAADARARAETERSEQTEQERQMITDAYDVAMDMAIDEEVAMPVDASLVLSRYHDTGRRASIAERARRNREWKYGHVIVDEAQELSPMAWRILTRRCPTLSMTVVGDVAQTGAPDGVNSWADALDRLAPGSWRRARLTVNYRTPQPIMTVAGDVLAAGGSDAVAPRSVRPDGDVPWAQRVSEDDLPDVLPAVVKRERDAIGEGTLAFIVPRARLDSCLAAVRAEVPEARAAGDFDMLDAPVAVITPEQAKGLEFDATVVVTPDELLAASTQGYADLYVALTRPTRRLGVLHVAPLPPALSRLARDGHGHDHDR